MDVHACVRTCTRAAPLPLHRPLLGPSRATELRLSDVLAADFNHLLCGCLQACVGASIHTCAVPHMHRARLNAPPPPTPNTQHPVHAWRLQVANKPGPGNVHAQPDPATAQPSDQPIAEPYFSASAAQNGRRELNEALVCHATCDCGWPRLDPLERAVTWWVLRCHLCLSRSPPRCTPVSRLRHRLLTLYGRPPGRFLARFARVCTRLHAREERG